MFNGKVLYTLELKSVGTNAISFERTKEDKGVIHKHQIDNLKKFSTYTHVVRGLIFDSRLSDKTYFCMIDEFINIVHNLDTKPFNEKDMFEWCNPIVIEKKKLKVNYRYDVCKFLKDTEL